MKKIFLLVIIANIIAQNSFAECIVPPSCSDMGYTQNISDCAGGKSLKCPFDTSKVICLNQEGSSSTTTPPSTPCVDGALVFTDGTCSYYENYETDDNRRQQHRKPCLLRYSHAHDSGRYTHKCCIWLYNNIPEAL